MGAAIGTDDKKSLNIELNIVPFIDLMSCLTAFLLLTAVWVNIAQLNIQPKGKTRDQQQVLQEDERVNLSVLITADQIWVGLSRVNEFQPIPKLPSGAQDWTKFETTLKDHKASAFFADRTDVEIAAESTPSSVVSYQDLITAMDTAHKVGFADVGLSDPQGLSARPQL
jgi:biopolymer transport protein ExbD